MVVISKNMVYVCKKSYRQFALKIIIKYKRAQDLSLSIYV